MMRIVFAMTVGVGLIACAVPCTSEAAPTAPLPSAVTNHNVTQAWWWHSVCRRNRWGRLSCRRIRVS